MNNRSLFILILVLLLPLLGAACDLITSPAGTDQELEPILASGVIEAEQINIASELSGRIQEIYIEEGSSVSEGDLLFRLEDDLLLIQKAQAVAQYEAALAMEESANATLLSAEAFRTSAEANLNAADIQYEQVLAQVHALERENRVADWIEIPPSQIELPAWYFQQNEEVGAARTVVDLAWIDYQKEITNYQLVAEEIGGEDFLKAEERLVHAQAAFWVAAALRDRQTNYWGRQEIREQIEKIFDSAEEELEEAQTAYNQLLEDSQYDDILEARARVSVSKERYDLARDYWASQSSGDYSFDVLLAKALRNQAESGLRQAEAQIIQAENGVESATAAVNQAAAALDLVNLQLEKTLISSPIAGVVLSQLVEPGEMTSAGLTALTIGDLSYLTVTVYLPENRYGQISLGDQAQLSIDSFPDLSFDAEVIYIADEAEYTPRNVQTQEERQNTVYAIKLRVTNTNGILKPGMPADVVFNP
jgi:multidrug resistance efflux pump